MKSNYFLWLIVAAVVLAGGYYVMNKPAPSTPAPVITQTATPVPAFRPITVELKMLNDLGQSGTATFSENASGKLVVMLALAGGTFTAPQPTHIHFGSCPNVGDVKYPLTSVVNGQSVTTLDVSWDDLVKTGEKLALNVHKSGAESKVYTACGNLPL